MKSMVPPKAHPILATLEYFRHLQTGCFGWDLCTDYKERIQSFTKSVETLHYYAKTFLKLKVTIPWKLHMVCCHLEPLLTKMGRGLAIFSEQAGEAVHCKFKKTKARYNKNLYHSRHGKDQKAAVVYWSSWNVFPVTRSTLQRYRDKWKLSRQLH